MLKQAIWRGLAVLLFVPVLAACAEPARLSVAEAADRYEKLSVDVSEALADAFPGQSWIPVDGRATGIAEDSGGRCILTVQPLRSPNALNELAGGWESVMAAIGPVLKEGGLDPITDEDSIKGGWTGISPQDRQGGQLRIQAKSVTEIAVSAQIQDKECP